MRYLVNPLRSLAPILAIALGMWVTPTSAAQQPEPDPLDKIQWKRGPASAKVGDKAEIRVPQGYVFANGNDTRILMEALRNPTSGDELGTFAPEDLSWFCIFSFDDTGYIRDDEKDTLDAKAMLEAIKRGTEESNVERKRRGWPPMSILGWEQKPRYNDTTHNLEWAIRGISDGTEVANHSTRLLGRSGVMKVVLVADPEALPRVLPVYQKALEGYSFTRGNTYAEFKPGDKVAKYGLTALVVGGATAVAVKSGFMKYIGKILVVAFAAVAAGIKGLFSRSKSG